MARHLILLTCLIAPLTSEADFETAAEAYRSNNYPVAFDAFMDLAESGDARAQTIVAMMYKYGESVEADPAASFRWYLEAARAGYAPAMFNVGDMYRTGIGIEADPARAIEWLKRAAEAGYERANQSLAILNQEPVSSETRADPKVPWSQAWDFRLPNSIRFADTADIPAVVEPDLEYRAQLGAMRSRAGANRLWDWLNQGNPRLFRGLQATVLLTERDQQQLYRVQAGPFEDLSRARAFCQRLLRAEPRADCLPVR